MTSVRPAFVDASYAAELLGVTTPDVLEWITEGKLTTFGGSPRNPFVRLSQVEILAQELGRDISQPPAKRRASQNPVRRVELRIRHDARWSEITDDDILAWAKGLDEATRAASLRVVSTAIERLRRVLDSIRSNEK